MVENIPMNSDKYHQLFGCLVVYQMKSLVALHPVLASASPGDGLTNRGCVC